MNEWVSEVNASDFQEIQFLSIDDSLQFFRIKFHFEGVIIISVFLLSSGRPLPSVYWYLNDQLIDGTYQQTYDRTIKNGLYIERLKREHTQGRLRCLASNNNITRPVETSVQLKMLCKYHQADFGVQK